MQQQNKIEFEVQPREISVTHNRGGPHIVDMELGGDRQMKLGLSFSEQEMRVIFAENVPGLDNRYKITIENITEQPKPHELLQKASNSVKMGDVKLGIEQAIKAMQKLAEHK